MLFSLLTWVFVALFFIQLDEYLKKKAVNDDLAYDRWKRAEIDKLWQIHKKQPQVIMVTLKYALKVTKNPEFRELINEFANLELLYVEFVDIQDYSSYIFNPRDESKFFKVYRNIAKTLQSS